MECAQEVPCAEEPVAVAENQMEEAQAPEPVEQQQTETPVVSQQGTGNHAKIQEREHRIGLLSQRISELEKEGNFTKERKLELSNLRKKLRIDKHNHNRYIKKIGGSSIQ
jgi:small-conductance mechanosensitive channel